MDAGFEYSRFVTVGAEYYCFDNVYMLNVSLGHDGMVEGFDPHAKEMEGKLLGFFNGVMNG